MYHTTRRFSELRAEGVESNLFQYHLRHIIKQGLVEKCSAGYQLAPAGLYYADRFSAAAKGERLQPKIIIIPVIENSHSEVAMTQKMRQPFVGQYHLPAGKIHPAEDVHMAASREVREKLGIETERFTYQATVHVTIRQQDVIISEYYGFIMHAHLDVDAPSVTWWDTMSDMVLAPSVRELIEISRHKDERFHEITIDDNARSSYATPL